MASHNVHPNGKAPSLLTGLLAVPVGLPSPGTETGPGEGLASPVRPGVVALIKPQFEAGPGQVGKNGVVRDAAVHDAVCAMVAAWWTGLPSWTVLGVQPSPITGPEGNREFLIAARLKADTRLSADATY